MPVKSATRMYVVKFSVGLNEASFRVGAKTFLDVTSARGTFEKAQIDRVNSIYEYHKAFAALENAVGRPLR